MSTGNEEHQGNDEHEGDEEERGEHDEQEGNEAPFEVTPETVVEMLGAPAHTVVFGVYRRSLLPARRTPLETRAVTNR